MKCLEKSNFDEVEVNGEVIQKNYLVNLYNCKLIEPIDDILFEGRILLYGIQFTFINNLTLKWLYTTSDDRDAELSDITGHIAHIT